MRIQAAPRGTRKANTDSRGRKAGPGTREAEPEPKRKSHVRTLGQRIPKAAELLAQKIASEIVAEALAPGERLPLESEMIEQYGVGRSTVREALRVLEVSGLITMRTGRNGGPMVGDAGPASLGRMVSLFMHANGVTLGEIIEARVLIEPALLRAALDSDDGTLARRAADLKRRSLEGDLGSKQEYRLLTREFHEMIATASNNRPLALLGMALMFLTRLDHEMLSMEHRRKVMAEHDKILDAIVAGNRKKCEALMAVHMANFRASVVERQPQDMDRIINWRWT